MRVTKAALATVVAAACLTLFACGQADSPSSGSLEVVASTTWLAEIAQNVAGDRFTVDPVIPLGADPHSFDPAPADLAAVARADLLLLNGGGLEALLEDALLNTGGDVETVVASRGLTPRTPGPAEPGHHDDDEGDVGDGEEIDAHFWLDPVSVKTYVANVRDAFVAADPAGADEYRANADAYLARLDELDAWVRAQVETIPEADRKLVMNHASHGYFADRYGFEVVGAVIPSVSTGATPTAAEMADLTRTIREQGVRAIFVEAEENPQLAEQIAAETGVTVVDDLLAASLTPPDGSAPTYIDMIRFDTSRIVEALRR